jgi:hypothetical protein
MSDINNTNTDENKKEELLKQAISIVEGILSSNPNTSLGDVLSNTNKSAEGTAESVLNKLNFFKGKGAPLSILYYILYPVAIIIYIIIYIIFFIGFIILNIIFYIITLSSRLSKLIGDIEFFYDVDPGVSPKPNFYERFLFIDLLDKDVKYSKGEDGEDNIKYYNTTKLGKEIEEIFIKINTMLKNRLQKYKSIIKNLKDKQIEEEKENNALVKWKEYVANEQSNLKTKIKSEELMTLFDNFGSGAKTSGNWFIRICNFIFEICKFILKFISLVIGFIFKYAFELLKLFMIVILSFFKSFMQFATTWFGKWTRPFAGFMILLIIIGIIVLSVYFTYETDDVDLDRGGNFSDLDTGGIGSNNNNNNRKRFTYDENTNIFDALYRLPGEIYSFTNDFTIFYNEILKRITFFTNFSSEIMNDARNFGEDSIEYSRTDNINSEGINDNIYTFDAEYIRELLIKKANPQIKSEDLYKYISVNNMDKKVVHLIKPIDIAIYTNVQIPGLKVNIENINGDGEYKIRCDGDFFDKSCKIKQFKGDTIETCKNIDKTPKDTDYNNILL